MRKTGVLGFTSRDIALIAVFSSVVTLSVALTSTPLAAATGGLVPVPVWAGLFWQCGGVFMRAMIGKRYTNLLSGLVEGIVGSFTIPIGVFGLMALPAQALVLEVVFGLTGNQVRNAGWAAVAGGLSSALFTYLVAGLFFHVKRPGPEAFILLGVIWGAAAGAAGLALARRVFRLGLLTKPG